MRFPESFQIQNLSLVADGAIIENAAVIIRDGVIFYAGPRESLPPVDLPSVDAQGWIVAPGFIDLQLNGAYGHDFTEQPENIQAVAKLLPETGVVAFLPTFITSPLHDYPQKLAAVVSAQERVDVGARVLGAHLEGPFLQPASKGAHQVSLFCDPDLKALRSLNPLSAVRLVTLAPERHDGIQAVHWLQDQGVVVSIGHSAATVTEAQQAFAAGVHYATHLYNAMPPLNHRQPGLIGAVLAQLEVRAGLIADGIHSHPVMLELAYRCKGSAGITLVSDAMAAMGMPPGQYSIGGQRVWVDDTSARLGDGRLAGSILRMDQAVRNMLAYTSCSLVEAIRMASTTPAEVLQMDDRLGHIKPGYSADLVFLDHSIRVQATLVGGKAAFVTPEAKTVFALRGADR